MDARTEKLFTDLLKMMDQSTSPAEAEVATAKFQRALMRHNIDEVEARRLRGEDAYGFSFRASTWQFAPDGAPGVTWKRNLVNTLAHFNFCKFISQGLHGGKGHMFGEARNVELVKEQYLHLVPIFERLGREYWDRENAQIPSDVLLRMTILGIKSSRRKWLASFLLGVPDGLWARLKAERDAERVEFEGANALVVANDSALAKFVKESFEKTKKMPVANGLDQDGYEAGYKTGKEYRDREAIGQSAVKALVG